MASNPDCCSDCDEQGQGLFGTPEHHGASAGVLEEERCLSLGKTG